MSINAIDTTNPQPTDGLEVLLAKIATILRSGLGINASDIEIGAVEVKDGASDQRATITAAGALKAVAAGTAADNVASVDNPQIVGGVAVNPASYSPAYTAGDAAQIPVDKDSGAALVSDRKKTRTDDAISADPKQNSTVSTATPVTTDGTIFTLAAGEKGVIQNLDDAAVYVKLGASASSSSFNFVLPACQSANDGSVPPIEIDDWIGAVSIAAATGSPRVSAYKLS